MEFDVLIFFTSYTALAFHVSSMGFSSLAAPWTSNGYTRVSPSPLTPTVFAVVFIARRFRNSHTLSTFMILWRIEFDSSSTFKEFVLFHAHVLSVIIYMMRACAATLVVIYINVECAEQMPGWVILPGWHSIRNIIRCSLSKEDNEPSRRLRVARMHYWSGERNKAHVTFNNCELYGIRRPSLRSLAWLMLANTKEYGCFMCAICFFTLFARPKISCHIEDIWQKDKTTSHSEKGRNEEQSGALWSQDGLTNWHFFALFSSFLLGFRLPPVLEHPPSFLLQNICSGCQH